MGTVSNLMSCAATKGEMGERLIDQSILDGWSSYFGPLFLVVLIGLFFYFVGKRLSTFTIKGKTYRIPPSIVTVILGVIVGCILRALIPGFSSFAVVGDLALVLTIMLFLSLGMSIDFRSFRKYGIWSLILGSIPYMIEWLLVTLILWPIIGAASDVTGGGALVSSALVSSLVALCSPGIIVPVIRENIGMGYEDEVKLNETLAFSSAIENVLSCLLIISLTIVYMSVAPTINGEPGASYSTTVVILIPVVAMALGFVIAIIYGILTLLIIRPICFALVKPVKIETDGLVGEELTNAKEINKKQERKTNMVIFAFVVILYTISYYLFQYYIIGGMGFLFLEVSLIHGLIISKLSENNISLAKTQRVIASGSTAAFNKYGCYFVWGFGGSLIVPMVLFGSTWFIGTPLEGIPNMVAAFAILLIAVVGRFIGILVATLPTKKFTFKQKVYSMPIMLTTGLPGLNNAVGLKQILPDSTFSTYPTGSEVNAGHTPLGFTTIEVLVVSSAVETLILIPLGAILSVNWREKFIFAWKGISHGRFRNNLNKAIKKEKLNKAKATELRNESKHYWELFFEEKLQSDKFKKQITKPTLHSQYLINYYEPKVESLILKRQHEKQKNQEWLESLAGYIGFCELSLIRSKCLKEKEKAECKRLKHKDKFDKTIDSINTKIEEANKILQDAKQKHKQELELANNTQVPEKLNNVINEKAESLSRLQSLIEANLTDQEIIDNVKLLS